MLSICLTQDISVKPGCDPIKVDPNIVRYAGSASRKLDVYIWLSVDTDFVPTLHTCLRVQRDLTYVTYVINNPKAIYQVPHWNHIVSFFSELNMDVCYKGRCGISIFSTPRNASFYKPFLWIQWQWKWQFRL